MVNGSDILVKVSFLLLGFVVVSPFNFVNSILYYFIKLYPEHNVPFVINLPSNLGVLVASMGVYWLGTVLQLTTRVVGCLSGLALFYLLILVNQYWILLLYCLLANFLAILL